MLTNKEIQAMLIRYPDGVNKEMFRKICHISPRMAQYLLETQLVPCEIKAQRTHRYWIATADMVAYLRDREKHPERYFYPNQRDNGEHEPKRKHRRIKDRPSKYQLQALTDKDQIDYWELMDDNNRDEIENILSIMVEVMSTKCEYFTISGKQYPADLVHQRFSQINSSTIEYVLECLHKCGSDIRNIKQYLIAALFNAPATYDSYYSAAVRRDFEFLRR